MSDIILLYNLTILYAGFSGFRFNGVSGGEHTVTVESRSTNGLTTATSTGTITVRGEDAILITDIESKLQY